MYISQEKDSNWSLNIACLEKK